MRRALPIIIVLIALILGGCAMTCPNRLHNSAWYSMRGDNTRPDAFYKTKTITFKLEHPGITTVLILDQQDAVVDTVVSQYLEAGEHRYLWDSPANTTSPTDPTYNVRIIQGEDVVPGRMIYLEMPH